LFWYYINLSIIELLDPLNYDIIIIQQVKPGLFTRQVARREERVYTKHTDAPIRPRRRTNFPLGARYTETDNNYLLLNY